MTTRIFAAAFWIFAGVMHFVIPRQYEAIVPTSIEKWKREVVVVSGVAEIAGGLMVLPEPTRRLGRWWLLATLAAVYPANIQMALNPEKYKKVPPAALWGRLPLQFAFAWMTWRATE